MREDAIVHNEDLFPTEEESGSVKEDIQPTVSPPTGAPPKVGSFVTNHRNLLYMLGAGLLMPPSGFGDKYRRDTLDVFPGWLPLFIGQERKVAEACRAALKDAMPKANARPIVVEVELENLRGLAWLYGKDGWAERRLEKGVDPDEWLLLVPTPVPISRIRSINFCSPKEKNETVLNAKRYANAPLMDFPLKTKKSLFEGSSKVMWPPTRGPEERAIELETAQAVGGVIAALYQMANGHESLLHACRVAFDPTSDALGAGVSEALPAWIRTGTSYQVSSSTTGKLLWDAVERLVKHRRQPREGEPEDVLLDFLKDSLEQIEGDRRSNAVELVETLESLGGGLGGGTINEMLNKHGTPLGRAAILFFLRKRTGDLLDLLDDYPELSEKDRLAAAILFGVRDGWLKMPLPLRGTKELADAVTHRMAALCHAVDGSGFDLGAPPPRVRPLRELFGDRQAWGQREQKREQKAAVDLARRMKWDCIRTRVSLGRGRYDLEAKSGKVHFEFHGEPEIRTYVEPDGFLEYLSKSRIGPKIESEVRKQLGA